MNRDKLRTMMGDVFTDMVDQGKVRATISGLEITWSPGLHPRNWLRFTATVEKLTLDVAEVEKAIQEEIG